jgi:methyltransferase-like protein/ubiquinone/menaquinone biosynthesis C-methylase UbiE
MSRESYDAVPYPAQPFAPSHPRNLEAIAKLLAIDAPPIETARVLELGCATGGNLVPMAAALPNANFVGIDYSQVQIDQAQRFADAASLKNISLQTLSILDIPLDFGRFDYIIAHGLLSWVPPDVQRKTFEVIRDHLTENGVAYISFNAFPGWHSRQWTREMMTFHAPRIEGQSADDRVHRAREICEIVAESPEIAQSPAGALLKREMAGWIDRPARYVVHDYLEESNWPFYFHDFVAQARAHDLEYLADAQNNAALFETGSGASAKLFAEAKDDIVRREQYIDFLKYTPFRRSLLIHRARKPDRAALAERFENLFVTSRLATNAQSPAAVASAQVMQFMDNTGTALQINHPLTKAVLIALQQPFPQAIRVSEMLDRAGTSLGLRGDDLATARARTKLQLLRAWSMNLVQLYTTPPVACTRAGDHPMVWPVARHQAASGALELTNLRHELVPIEPPFDKIITLLDGTRSRGQLADELLASDLLGLGPELADKPVVRRQAATKALEKLLERFAKESLLVG